MLAVVDCIYEYIGYNSRVSCLLVIQI